ncbi:hypothetical protein ACFL27_25940 [candidate division CSSED10-310 bacterium]|uniref:Uncharacterized protein n=1 Tax=candidate division CSSED10-310 bacterium TaxID=2855610 RepID=A0ABV6Z5D5_UNCC1
MGNFYTNITVWGPRINQAPGLIRDLGREAYIINCNDACVIYDRECENQDSEILAALAEHVASKLETISFAVLNHDDDILWFQLYNGSDLVAEYANQGGPKTDVQALCKTFNRPGTTIQVRWFLLKPFIFQVTRHDRLARALGIPAESVGFGYHYINKGELPAGIEKDEVIHITRWV